MDGDVTPAHVTVLLIFPYTETGADNPPDRVLETDRVVSAKGTGIPQHADFSLSGWSFSVLAVALFQLF